MSTGLIAGLMWLGTAAHRPKTTAVVLVLVDRLSRRHHGHTEGGYLMARSAGPSFDLADDPNGEWDPIEKRLGALPHAIARCPNIDPGEDFTGYS